MNAITRLHESQTELTLQYYGQLKAINNDIAARMERPYPTREENTLIRQITSTLRLLHAKSSVITAMEALIRFATRFCKAAPALGELLLPQLCLLLLPGISLPEELLNGTGSAKPDDDAAPTSAHKTSKKSKPRTTSKPHKAPALENSSSLTLALTLNDVLEDSSSLTPALEDSSSLTPALTLNNAPALFPALSEVLPSAPALFPALSEAPPTEGQHSENGYFYPTWRGVLLNVKHPNGQTEDGRTLEERMMSAQIRNDRRALKRYIKLATYMPLAELFGKEYDRRENPQLPLQLPSGKFSARHTTAENMRIVMRPWKTADDGLPAEEMVVNEDGTRDTYWMGVPLSFTYLNGQTEAGRSLYERLYCARYRRNKGHVERLLVQAALLPPQQRFGREAGDVVAA